MSEIIVHTRNHCAMIPITDLVLRQIPEHFSGFCHLFCPHTTAALTVNENTDPDVCSDIMLALEKMVPWDNPDYNHAEGNSAAHVKASLIGFDLLLPVSNGNFDFGCWQGIYFCEFDGPRDRKVHMTLCPANPASGMNSLPQKHPVP